MWNPEKVKLFLTAVFNNDVATISPLLSENVLWHTPQSAPMTHQGGKVGREATLAMLSGGPNSPYLAGSKKPTVETVVIDANTVVARYTMRSLLKSGQPYENEYCLVLRLGNDLIVETWEHVDSVRFYAMLGVDPVWVPEVIKASASNPAAAVTPRLSSTANAERAVAFISAFHTDKAWAESSILARDVRWHRPVSMNGSRELPYSYDEVAQMGAYGTLSPFLPGSVHIAIEVSVGDGDLAAVQLSLSATMKGGGPYVGQYGYVMRLDGGRITEVWEHLDTVVLKTAAGSQLGI